MNATGTPIPHICDGDFPKEWERRVFGTHGQRLVFHDGRVVDLPHRGGAADLAWSMQAGRDESFTAYCTDQPWFEFRTGEVARIEVGPPATLADDPDGH